MSRIRTHNNRRRARALKQGGLYSLQRNYGRDAALDWADRGTDPVADIRSFVEAWIA